MKIFLIGSLFLVSLQASAFTDVSTMDPQMEAILYMKEQNVVQGYEDGSFRPMNPINRAEFTKIIIGSEYNQNLIENCVMNEPFSDVPTNAWFYPYVCIAKAQGIIEGYSDGTFQPTKEITFPEAAKIMLETLKKEVSSDPIWYKPYIEKLGTLKAIPTSIPSIDQALTRGQMAEILFRLKTEPNKDSKTYQSFFAAETSTVDNTNSDTTEETPNFMNRQKGSPFDREAFLAESKAQAEAEKAESEANLKARKEAEAALIEQEMLDREQQNLRALFDMSYHRSVLIKHCEEKWESDHSMVKYCIEKELEAIEDIQRNDHPDLSDAEDLEIFLNCYNDWEGEYSMIEYCLTNQQESLKAVKEIKEDALKERCEDTWGDDYDMVLFCYREG